MPPLSTVRARNADYYTNRPLVAVFIGATSGIGEYAARALTKQYGTSKTPLRLYIAGRSPKCADTILSDCSKVYPEAQLEFIKVDDLTLIRGTDQLCDEIIHLETQKSASEAPRIDLLVMTQGDVNFGGRQETSEGLDRSMSLLYYSRVRAITRLLPLLSASPAPHVVSVYAAGMEGKLISDDLSLRKPKNYSFMQQRSHTVHFKTVVFERLARENPKLSLVHAFPGLVITPRFYENDAPVWFKVAWWIVGPFCRWFIAQTPVESGDRIIHLGTSRFSGRELKNATGDELVVGTDGFEGSGAYAVGQYGDAVKHKADYAKLRKDGFEDTVWEHTMKAFSDIERTGCFKD